MEEPLPTELPIAAGTSRHLPSLDGSDSRFFYINAMNYSGPASPAILQRKGNGLWQIASRYDGALTKSTTAQYTTWSHDESATFLYQCKLGWCMGGGGDIEVNLWRPYPHSNPIIISKSSVMIPLVDPLSNHIIEGVNTYTGEYHNFYTFTDSSIQPVDISISGEIHKITSSFEDVIDVDGDGYEDLVEYPLNTTTGLPIVYINNKSGGLIYEDLSPYISIQKPFGGWGGLDSKLLDANADGIMDILFFPESSSVQNAKSAKKYLLFLGRKKLKLN